MSKTTARALYAAEPEEVITGTLGKKNLNPQIRRTDD